VTLDPRLVEMLACPEDKGALLYLAAEDSLYNPRLRRRYRIRDGIPVLLVDEAEAVDDAEHGRLLSVAAEAGLTVPAVDPDGASSDDDSRSAP